MQAGLHELALTTDKTSRDHVPRQWWEGGIYENRYVKEDGKWRILVLNYHPLWHGTFEEGWA
jgi:carotenoid cleavage dioxygenase